MNVTLYQISYKPEHFSNPLAGTEVWDHSTGDPILREYPAFKNAFALRNQSRDDDYWGLLSPKFYEKTRVTPDKFSNWIQSNPGYDVYFINPCPIQESVFRNVVEQGERFHKGIADIIRFGLPYHADPLASHMDRHTFTFCNFFVGSYYFWKEYTKFVDNFLEVCGRDEEMNERLYRTGAKYSYDTSLPYYSFVIERLFSVFLWSQQPNSLAYEFSFEEQQHKMSKAQFDEMKAIRQVKEAAVTGGKEELWNTWETLRYYFINRNPYLLNAE